MVARLMRMGLALGLAAGVYLLLIAPSTSLEFTPAVQVEAPTDEPLEGPGLSVTNKGQPEEPVAIVLPRSHDITGTVLDEKGKPVAQVRVELVHVSPYVNVLDATSALDWQDGWIRRMAEGVRAPAPRPVESFVETDEKGHFKLTTKAWGNYRVRAMPEPPRYGTQQLVYVRERPPEPIELRTGPGETLAGSVLDMADKPVAASLTLSSSKLPFGTWHSDPLDNDPQTGSFSFEGVPPGEYRITCVVPGRLRLTGITLTIPRDDPLVIRVPSGGASLVGTVKGPAGECVGAADVLASVPLADGSATIEAVGKTDAEGAYALEHLPAGPVTKLTVGASGYLHHVGTLPLAPWAGAEVPDKGSTRIDVTLLKGAAVHGLVTLKDGTPLKDVAVMVVPSRWRPPAQGAAGPLVTQTDETGAFRIEGVPIGKHVLFATHEELYIPSIEDVANQAGPPPELLVLVDESAKDVERHVVMAKGIPIAGQVLDQDDEPVADARIVSKGGLQNRWWNSWGVSAHLPSMGTLAHTAEDGTFAIKSLPPKTDWVLGAKADGRLGAWSEPLSNEAERAEPVTLRMELGVAVRGTVVDKDGPVPLIQVRIWTRNQKVLAGNLSTKTNDDGTFEILGVPTGDANLNAYDGAGRHGYLQLKGIEAGEDREDLEITLQGAGVELSGVLRDEDEKPLANYRIQARGSGPDPYGRTDAQGRFAFKRGPSGLIRFRVQQPGGRWTYIKEKFRSPADDIELTFKPQKQRVVQGKVLGPDRKPVPIVQVQVGVGKKPKDRAWRYNRNLIGQEVIGGTFKISVLGEGPVWIRAQSARDENGQPLNAQGVTKAFPDEDELSQPVEIVLEEGLTVSGKVVGPEEEVVPGALVQSGRFMARTQDDGTFVMRGLPEGKVQLSVRPPIEYSAPPATKTEGGAEDVEIVLLKAAVLRGQVTDADGAGISGGRAYVRWKGPKGRNTSRSGHLDGNGRFVVKGIPAGTLVTVEARLWGRHNRGRVTQPQTDVDPNAGPVVLVAERGASISGYVVGADRRPVQNVYVRANRIDTQGLRRQGNARTNARGEFRIQGLIEGEYRITTQAHGSLITMTPMLVVAPAENLRIQLPPSTEIRGRIDDPGGASGWRVMVVRPENNRSTHVSVKPDGTWVATRVGFDETYTVRAYNINANLYAIEENVAAGARDVVLQPRDGLTISGRVELLDGAPTQGYIYAQGPGWSISRTSDADGNFSIGPFPPGRFSMWVYQQNVWDNHKHIRDIAAGTGSLIVQLPK